MAMSRAWLVLLIATAACRFDPKQGTTGTGIADAAEPDTELGAWLEPWQHRKTITLHESEIEAPQDTALANFPVLVSVTDLELAAAANADGGDIVFTAGDATTPLDREIESYAAGTLVAWVKIPSLPATTDTVIYMYYGNPTAPVATGEAGWTEQFLAVYHLNPDLAATRVIADAAHDHDGVAEASMVPADTIDAQIGRGLDFDGMNDFVDVPAADVGTAFTISLWMNLADQGQIHTLVSNSPDNANTNGFRFFANSNGSNDRRIVFETGNGGQSDSVLTAPQAVSAGTWSHVAVVVDRGSGRAEIMVDGVVANTNTDFSVRNDFATASDFELGRMESNNPYIGQLDEVEIATTARSQEWLRTAFANQRKPATFHLIGAEETR
jgi:MSHA biogenesis protein MshQ